VNGIYDIMSHQWFKSGGSQGGSGQTGGSQGNGFTWDGLRKLQLKPPFQPSSKVVLKKPPKDLNNYCLDTKNEANIAKLVELDNKFQFDSNFGQIYPKDFPDIWTDF
jgi:hypothetical protein